MLLLLHTLSITGGPGAVNNVLRQLVTYMQALAQTGVSKSGISRSMTANNVLGFRNRLMRMEEKLRKEVGLLSGGRLRCCWRLFKFIFISLKWNLVINLLSVPILGSADVPRRVHCTEAMVVPEREFMRVSDFVGAPSDSKTLVSY
jgi:hypothetical protein